MYRKIMKSKIHRATVSEANLNYVGSITIDENLLESSNIYINELVQVVNINNGQRFETYTIPGKKNSGVICVNGAAARLVQPGDKIIIISYAIMEDSEYINHVPKILFLDNSNSIVTERNMEAERQNYTEILN